MSEDGVPSVTDTPFEPPIPDIFGDGHIGEHFQPKPRRLEGRQDSILPHEVTEHDAQELAQGHGLYDSDEMPMVLAQRTPPPEDLPVSDFIVQQFLAQRAMATYMSVKVDLHLTSAAAQKDQRKKDQARRNALKEHQSLDAANAAGGGGVAA